MHLDRTLKANTESIAQDTIEGEVIVIHFPTGNYFSMSGMAATIWQWLLEGYSPTAVVDGIRAQRPEANQRQIQAFVEELVLNGLLIEGAEAPSSKAISWDRGDAPFEPPKLRRYDDMQELIVLDPVHEVDDRTGWPEAQ